MTMTAGVRGRGGVMGIVGVALVAVVAADASGALDIQPTLIPFDTAWPGNPGNPAQVNPDKAGVSSRVVQTFPQAPLGGVRGDAADMAQLNALLKSNFECAVAWWKAAIMDDHMLKLSYGWDDLQFKGFPATAAAIFQSTNRDAAGRTTEGVIRFDNSAVRWYLDATPPSSKADNADGNEEYQNATETTEDLDPGVGVKNINTERYRLAVAGGNADGRVDIFSVALHEIGHALNIDSGNPNYLGGDIKLTKDRPAGSMTKDAVVTVVAGMFGDEGLHLNYRTAMAPSSGSGERRTLAATDILAAAELSDFTKVELDPKKAQVPEPTGLALGLIAAAAAVVALRRRSQPAN